MWNCLSRLGSYIAFIPSSLKGAEDQLATSCGIVASEFLLSVLEESSSNRDVLQRFFSSFCKAECFVLIVNHAPATIWKFDENVFWLAEVHQVTEWNIFWHCTIWCKKMSFNSFWHWFRVPKSKPGDCHTISVLFHKEILYSKLKSLFKVKIAIVFLPSTHHMAKKHLLFSKSQKKPLWSKHARMFQVTTTFGRIGFFCGNFNLLVTNCFFFGGVIFLSTIVCFTTFWKLNLFLFPIFVWDTNLSDA